MTQYLVAIHHPNDFVPGSDSAEAARDIDMLNAEMNASGIVVFVGGLGMADNAKSIRVKDGRPMVSDGPYLETKEHIGGFWVLDVADEDEALAWAERATVACEGAVEVRPFQGVATS